MMGKLKLTFESSLMLAGWTRAGVSAALETVSATLYTHSAIHCLCESSSLQERPMGLTLRFSHSFDSLATSPSSVVQTGVKSLSSRGMSV